MGDNKKRLVAILCGGAALGFASAAIAPNVWWNLLLILVTAPILVYMTGKWFPEDK